MSVDLLLKAGAGKDAHDSDGWPALMYAFGNGHHVCVDLLLKAGANQDIEVCEGHTALSRASGKGHQACIQLLQQAHAASAEAAATMSSLLDDLEEKGKRGVNDACYSGCGDRDKQQGPKLEEEVCTHTHTHKHIRAYAHAYFRLMT